MLLFVDRVAAAPTGAVKGLISLWSAFWFPIHIIPEFGFFLERMLLLSSPKPAIKVAPSFVGWVILDAAVLLLLAFLRSVRLGVLNNAFERGRAIRRRAAQRGR